MEYFVQCTHAKIGLPKMVLEFHKFISLLDLMLLTD